jgi:hypothetical protein
MAKMSNAELQQQLTQVSTQRDNAVAFANYFGGNLSLIETKILELNFLKSKRPLLWIITNAPKIVALISFIIDTIKAVKEKVEELNKQVETPAPVDETAK